MQAARGAVKDLREKGKSFVKPKYADQLLGSGLEEQIRRATAKSLPGPDLALNRRIVETINAELNQYSAHQLASVLKGRLTLKNAHKQWLALELVQEILEGCPKVIEPARSDILEDVAQIAAQPMNRYGSDLPGQQHCKNASFALLKKYGHEGQDAMREAVGLGGTTRFDKDDVPDLSRLGRKSVNEPYGKSDLYSRRSDDYGRNSHREGSSADNSFSAVREKVQMGIATSHSHTEMLQDMVLNLSEGASRRDADHDKSVLKDLVKDMVTFRNKFEGTLESLSQFETREAQSLMTEALEAMDTMNNAIILQNEVLTARKSRPQDSVGHTISGTSSTGAGGSSSRLAPSPHANLPPQQQHQAPPPPAQPQQPSYLDAITELQQAMDRAHVSQGPPTPQQGDPFASSYFHPSGQSGSGDPFAQSSVGQSSSGQPSFGHHPAPEPYHHQQLPQLPQLSQQHYQQQQQQQQLPQQHYQQQQQKPLQQLPQQQYQQQAPPQGPASSHNPFAEGGGFASAQGDFGPASSSVPPHSYSNPPQHLGPRAPNNATAAPDPFDHLPYPSLGLSRPTKPERAPAPPLASYGKGGPPNSQQLSGQQDDRSVQSVPGLQPPQQAQQQQQQSQVSNFDGNIWAQPDAGGKDPGATSFEFGESAFKPVQTTPPQQNEARPKEAVRPRNLYINSLYNAEGGGDEQLPAGFDPSHQVLTRGTGSWGMASPASSPNKTGGYMGGSGPPTPEGLQFQHQHSAGSSATTTPAQSAGNSEWDMFFANRVQPNGNGGPGGMSHPPQQQQQASSQMPDAFDDLLFARAR
ncbi:hypothetical protein WJX77_001574 [Trebouxia sp. C0004]